MVRRVGKVEAIHELTKQEKIPEHDHADGSDVHQSDLRHGNPYAHSRLVGNEISFS